MEIVYRTIFFYSEGHNYLNGRVCSEFRQLAPKVKYLAYVDQVLTERGEVKDFVPSEEVMEAAIDGELFHVIEACEDIIPKDRICYLIAIKGKLQVLKWARSKGYLWDEWTCAYAARFGHLEMLKWARANSRFYRLAIKFFTKLRFVKNLLG
nr:ankyrin repeat protein [Cedratvirus borely]